MNSSATTAARAWLALGFVLLCGVGCGGEDTNVSQGAVDSDTGADTGVAADTATPDTQTSPAEDTSVAPDLPVIEEDTGATADTRDPETCGLEDGLAPNQDAADAHEAGTDFLQEGLYVCPGTSDWFSFEATAGQTIFVYAEFEAEFGDLDLYLYRAGQARDRESALADSTSPNQSEFITFEVEEDGTYLVEMTSFEFAQNQYSIFIKVACDGDADCPEGRSCFLRGGYCNGAQEISCGIDEGYEPNESISQATEIDLTTSDNQLLVDLSICPDDTDYYAINLGEPSSLEITLTGDEVDLFLFDVDGQFIANASEPVDGERVLMARFLDLGTYIVLVDQLEEAEPTTYSMRLTRFDELCESDLDCVGVSGREFCDDAGACEGIAGDGRQGLGEPCDDDSDCDELAAGCYEGTQGSGDNLCTVLCEEDRDCAAGLGEDSYCLEIDRFRGTSICVNPCEDDFDCSFSFFCGELGRCESRACALDGDCRPTDACVHSDETQRGALCLDYDTYQSHTCGVGEAPDDGQNGSSGRAALLELSDGEAEYAGLMSCPDDEDWYVVELTEDSQLLGVSLSFTSGADMDIYLYDGSGRLVDQSITSDENPEEVSGRYLAAGRYFLRVNHFPTNEGPQETTYSLNLIGEVEDCRDDASVCNGTSPLRIECSDEAGACLNFEGNGAVELGGVCDSSDDCVESADFCWVFQGGGVNNICTHFCNRGSECADVPDTECVQIQRGIGACLSP
ncbi:MAG: hypothetical protein CMH57_08175 [Myxococcales bacterium]|nr:hypothetical protein [Myxococcales bacterium]